MGTPALISGAIAANVPVTAPAMVGLGSSE